jgi:hypothetical protein
VRKKYPVLLCKPGSAGISKQRLEPTAGVCHGRAFPRQLPASSAEAQWRADAASAAGINEEISGLGILETASPPAQKWLANQP